MNFNKILKETQLKELSPFTFQQAYNAINYEPKTAIECIEMMIIALIGLEQAHLEEAKAMSPKDVPLIRKVERCSTTMLYYCDRLTALIENTSNLDIKQFNSYMPILAGHLVTAKEEYSGGVESDDIIKSLDIVERRLIKLLTKYNESAKLKIKTWDIAIKEWNSFSTDKKNKINKQWEDKIRLYGTDKASLKPITKEDIVD